MADEENLDPTNLLIRRSLLLKDRIIQYPIIFLNNISGLFRRACVNQMVSFLPSQVARSRDGLGQYSGSCRFVVSNAYRKPTYRHYLYVLL